MPEFAPIARSPIAPTTGVADDGARIASPRGSGDLHLTDCAPLAKVSVRSQPSTAAADVLGVAHGRAKRSADGVLVVGSSPGEWTLIGDDGDPHALAKRACQADPDHFTSTIDQTHGRALMRLTGESAKDLLAKLCAIDLDERVMPNGTAFRSSVAKVVTDVARDDEGGIPSYLLHCERSSGQYLFDSLVDAGREFDLGVESSS